MSVAFANGATISSVDRQLKRPFIMRRSMKIVTWELTPFDYSLPRNNVSGITGYYHGCKARRCTGGAFL